MKSGWEIILMGQLCSIKSGKSDTKDAIEDGAYAFFDRSRTIKKSSRYLYDCEALIIPGEGTEFLPKYFSGKFDLHQRAYALFDFSDRIDVRFLYYFLHYKSDYFPQVAVGATVKSLRLRHFEQLPVSLTSLPEQQRIVGILDEAFDGIATAKANAEKNLQNARALFESHLQSVFTQRGEGWVEKKLGEVYDVRDGTHDSPKYHATGFPLITSKNLKREGLSFDDVNLINEQDYAKINQRSAVHKGDVLFAMIGTIGNPTLVTVEPNFAIKNVALFKIPNGQSGAFLKHYLASGWVISKMMKESKGTTQKFVGLGYLRDFPINIPPLAIQLKVVASLEELSEETQHLESIYHRKIAALDELKKSLLHQAFCGEL